MRVLALRPLLPALVLATLAAAPGAQASAGPLAGHVVVAGLFRPEAVVRSPSAVLYVADTFNNRVVRADPGTTAPVIVAGGPFGQLGTYPAGVALDASGRLYVADTSHHRVLRYAPGSTVGTVVAGGPGTGPSNAGPGLDRLNTPNKVEVDAAGRLFVADTLNDRVVRWDPGATSGALVAGGSRGTGPDQLRLPVGLALDAAGAVYVADTQNHRVVRWAPGAASGTVVAGVTATRGAGPSLLDGPAGVDVDGAGNVLVADTQNHRVVRWAPGASSGVLVAGASRGPGPDQLDRPSDVVAGGPASFVVLDRDNGRVLRFGEHVQVLAPPELRALLGDLAAAGGPALVPATATGFAVDGCPSPPTALPWADLAYPAVLGSAGYPAADGSAAPPVPAGCAPDAVATTRRVTAWP